MRPRELPWSPRSSPASPTPTPWTPRATSRATIDWGDGSPMSIGTIVQPGGAGTPLVVLGNHTYAESGVYPVTTTINAAGGVVPDPDEHGPGRRRADHPDRPARSVERQRRVEYRRDHQGQPAQLLRHLFALIDHPAVRAADRRGSAIPIGQTAADASGAWQITIQPAERWQLCRLRDGARSRRPYPDRDDDRAGIAPAGHRHRRAAGHPGLPRPRPRPDRHHVPGRPVGPGSSVAPERGQLHPEQAADPDPRHLPVDEHRGARLGQARRRRRRWC